MDFIKEQIESGKKTYIHCKAGRGRSVTIAVGYLMATLQPFKEGYHPEAYRVPSLDGKDRCKFTRQIFVQKGQKVKNGEPVKVSFFRQVAPGATLMYEDVLYACDDDVCPEYTKDPRKSDGGKELCS